MLEFDDYTAQSKGKIAQEIGCDPSIIYRELARNCCNDWQGNKRIPFSEGSEHLNYRMILT